MNTRITKDFFLVLVLSLCVLVPFLGGYPLLEPDEARYVEIPREMVATGDYIVPRLNGVIYIEKPPLFYWAQTLTIKLFGIQEAPARFFNAFFAALTAAMTAVAGSLLYNRKTGLLSAALLISSLLFYAMAHFITLDMTLTAMLTGTLFSFLLGLQQPPSKQRRLWFYAGYTFAALAVLSKGLVGIVLPGGIIFLWLCASRRWKDLMHAYLPTGLCLFLAVALPWHLLMQARVSDFFDFYIIGQHFMRYATMASQRYQPWWFFIPLLLLGLFPWVVFYITAVVRIVKTAIRERKLDSTTLYLLIWPTLIFLFFSASHSKLVPYILPVMPPLALLLGKDMVAHERSTLEWWITLAILAVFAGGVILVPAYAKQVLPSMNHYFWIISVFITTVILAICVLLRQQRKQIALYVLGVSSVIMFTGMIYLWSSIADRSIKPLALIIKAEYKPGDEVVAYGKYIQDLPLYTEQLVTLVDKRGELEYGIVHEDHSDRFIDTAVFLKRWQDNDKRLWVVMSERKFQQIASELKPVPIIVGRTSRYVLISNEDQAEGHDLMVD